MSVGFTRVSRTNDWQTAMIIFRVQNDEMRELSSARNYICEELEDMRLLLGEMITVGAIDGSHMEFRVDVPYIVRDIGGAFEWVEKLLGEVSPFEICDA